MDDDAVEAVALRAQPGDEAGVEAKSPGDWAERVYRESQTGEEGRIGVVEGDDFTVAAGRGVGAEDATNAIRRAAGLRIQCRYDVENSQRDPLEK